MPSENASLAVWLFAIGITLTTALLLDLIAIIVGCVGNGKWTATQRTLILSIGLLLMAEYIGLLAITFRRIPMMTN